MQNDKEMSNRLVSMSFSILVHCALTERIARKPETNNSSLDSNYHTYDSREYENTGIGRTIDEISTRILFIKHIDVILPIQPVMRQGSISMYECKVEHTPQEENKRPPFRLDNEQRQNRPKNSQRDLGPDCKKVNDDQTRKEREAQSDNLPHTE